MVITTGSKRSGDRFTEAHASAVYLEQHGVPANAIVEVGGTTSYDSIAAAAKLLQGGLNGNQLERVLLVSDAYHSLRIRLVAQERGLTAYVSPTRTSPDRFTKSPLAPEVATSLVVRTYGALNGSGNALNWNPKLSSMVSARRRVPSVKKCVVFSDVNAPAL